MKTLIRGAIKSPIAPPDPISVKSVLRNAAEQLAIPEVPKTVFVDSLCLQGYYQPQTRRTPFVTYKTGTVPDTEMVVEIVRYRYAVLFTRSKFECYRGLDCHLLFTFHANVERDYWIVLCVQGTTVYVAPEGSIRTRIYIESGMDSTRSQGWRSQSGISFLP